jgi:hypothetical protein
MTFDSATGSGNNENLLGGGKIPPGALPGWVWRVRIVNRIGWDEMYGRLIVYQRANGHCRVPKVYKTEDGNRLGQWVGYQRTRRDEMDPERRRRLDALGFDWDPRANERRPAAE